jgi:methionine-rich copper-binding protein CopC
MRSSRLFPFASVAVALSLVTGIVTPATLPAMRHLRVVRTFPAADTVLAKSPDAVRLWLSEPAELAATRITLTNAQGKALSLGKPARDAKSGASVTAPVRTALAAGRYDVAWRSMSHDGHVVKGTFAFRVR